MDRCRSCNAEVRWAITNNGRRTILDDEPSPDGNVAQLMAQGETTTIDFAVVLSGQALARAQSAGAILRTSHFATCPNRDEHRRDAKRPAPGR